MAADNGGTRLGCHGSQGRVAIRVLRRRPQMRVLSAADGSGAQSARARLPASGLRPGSRSPAAGQIAVFTQTSKDDLVWTWWS